MHVPVDQIADRRIAALLTLAVGAVLVAVFWSGLREVPADWGCWQDEPAGNNLDAFRAGAGLLHGLSALTLLAAIVALSWRRQAPLGVRRPGTPTMIVAALCAGVVVATVVGPDAIGAVVVLVAGIVASGFGYGLLAGLACLIAGAVVRTRAAHALTTAGLWQAAVGAVPFHALVVYSQGISPIAC